MMNEVVSYIFKNLSMNELATKNLFKITNKQARAIRWTGICVSALGVHMIAKTLEDAARDKEIAQLKKEIEELKQKGD